MPESHHILSPAKLNLMLHITGQRDNGFHNLQTVFQLVGLYDELNFMVTESNQVKRVSGNEAVKEQDDLIVKSAKFLKHKHSINQGVEISIKKNIPMGGGLGGGSSNAATTLIVLNKLWNLNLSLEKLLHYGQQLGADIPFFIFGQNAWAEGTGNVLTPLKLPKKWFFVLHPQVFVSTEQIFSSKHLTRDSHPIKIRAFLEGDGKNVCEPIACELYPEIQKAINWLNQYSPARMTGTGACIFSAFDSFEEANAVKLKLPKKWKGFVAEGLNTTSVSQTC